MITPGKYAPGTTMVLTAAFSDTYGQPSDPAQVVIKTFSPCGDITSYTYQTDDNVTKTSTGNYAAIVTPNHAGRWRIRWEGTDASGNVIVIEDTFNVQRSRFVDGPCWDYR